MVVVCAILFTILVQVVADRNNKMEDGNSLRFFVVVDSFCLLLKRPSWTHGTKGAYNDDRSAFVEAMFSHVETLDKPETWDVLQLLLYHSFT